LCRQTHEELQKKANRSIDLAMVARNWLLVCYIVEYEQNGADRAEYGKKLFENLSAELKKANIKGSSATRLRLYRTFYVQFKGIRPTVSDEFENPLLKAKIQPTLSVESHPGILEHNNFMAISLRASSINCPPSA
jgi:hypothetical protein